MNFVLIFFMYCFLIHGVPAVLAAAAERAATFHQLDPVERNLQRVSHSIAYSAAVFAAYNGYSPILTHISTGIFTGIYTSIFDYSPDARSWQTGVIAAVLGVGVIRIHTGLRSFRFFNPEFFEHAPVLRLRAVVKTAIGIGGLIYLVDRHDAYIYAGAWWAIAYEVLGAVAAWCSVIGPVRLFLLRPRRNPDPGGPVEQDIRDREWTW